MDITDIKAYLANNTDFCDAQLDILAELVYCRINYSPIYSQIDQLTDALTQYEDWDQPSTSSHLAA